MWIVSHFVTTKHRMYIRIGIQVWLSKATLIGGLSLPIYIQKVVNI